MALHIGMTVKIIAGPDAGAMGTLTRIGSNLASVRYPDTGHQHLHNKDNILPYVSTTSPPSEPLNDNTPQLNTLTIHRLIGALDRNEIEGVRAFLVSLLPLEALHQGIQYIPTTSFHTMQKLINNQEEVNEADFLLLTSPHQMDQPHQWTPVLADASILSLLDHSTPLEAMQTLIQGADTFAEGLNSFYTSSYTSTRTSDSQQPPPPETTKHHTNAFTYNCHLCQYTCKQPQKLALHLTMEHDIAKIKQPPHRQQYQKHHTSSSASTHAPQNAQYHSPYNTLQFKKTKKSYLRK